MSRTGKFLLVIAILAAVVVYAFLIFAIRAITAEDVKLLPKGQKIYSVLRRFRLVK